MKGQGKLHIIGVDGSVVSEDIDAEPTLDRLHELVGGYIERISGFNMYADEQNPKLEPCFAFCNEEGKLERRTIAVAGIPIKVGPLPINRLATFMWWRQLHTHSQDDTLAGPVVVVTGTAILRAMIEGPPKKTPAR